MFLKIFSAQLTRFRSMLCIQSLFFPLLRDGNGVPQPKPQTLNPRPLNPKPKPRKAQQNDGEMLEKIAAVCELSQKSLRMFDRQTDRHKPAHIHLHISLFLSIYIYVYTCVHTYIHICAYIYIWYMEDILRSYAFSIAGNRIALGISIGEKISTFQNPQTLNHPQP